MANQVAAIHGGSIAAQQSESELIAVLQTSLYPGASTGSVKMVLGYCKAAGLDPMQKPVHIVPIWDKKSGTMIDVVMPGVGLYRTQAARSGVFAGISEPEFGPDVTENLGGVEITYPLWCRVIAKREIPSGKVVDFAAVERWKENYAIRGGKEKSIAPNSMWLKRPYAQLAKCAQAQSLRLAFPEVGSAPTADEMEGKGMEIEINPIPENNTATTSQDNKKKELPPYPEANFDKNLPAWQKLIFEGKSPDDIIKSVQSRYVMTDEQKGQIRAVTKREPATIDGNAMTEDEIAEAEAKQLAREGNE